MPSCGQDARPLGRCPPTEPGSRNGPGRVQQGVTVVAFEGATLHVSVTRPPLTAAQASHVALEHVLPGDENHVGELRFADYAKSLIGDRHWQSW
ncbi:MAG TPA: DUF4253 domain-containing protein [Streptosporangiaceae bacterium]|nr:DUF4253 domain-containing protein [Streptosporangiaceae bacterium]